MPRRSKSGRGRVYWSKLVSEYEETGATNDQAFAESRGINRATFRAWMYRLRREREEGVEEVPRFLEVVGNAGGKVEPAVVLRCGSMKLEFGQLPDAEYLGELLQSVRAE